jgi:predicted 3-demethylubiquinone-9 3-methyltransferase (glyoxalase superfamily)
MPSPLVTCLWFKSTAKEAADFYCSVFDEAKVTSTNPMVTTFEIGGSRFMAMNGATEATFTTAVSFVISCDDQAEIDRYWEALSADGGAPGKGGWVKDKFGVSWQVVPSILPTLMGDPVKVASIMKNMSFQTIEKFVISDLLAAAEGPQ